MYYTEADYITVEKIDAHVHVNTENSAFVKCSAKDNFLLLTINTEVPFFPAIQDQQRLALLHPGISYTTTFDTTHWHDPEWQQKTLAYLEESFAKGALGVKVWKNIGMELKDENGDFVMIDHSRFDPIFHYLAENNIPVIGHLGEPRNCWLPVEEMTVAGDRAYFSAHPQYHMYLHPEYPSYEEQIDARDRMLAKHPDLTFVGAHLASLEWNVEEVAQRLDRFPYMGVDLAERISHLQLQAVDDWQKVHDFCMKYQDRIIYGTDIIDDGSKSLAEMEKHAHDIRFRHWKFFTSDEKMRVPKVSGEFNGLKLPRSVVDKIYCTNAEKYYPGIKKVKHHSV